MHCDSFCESRPVLTPLRGPLSFTPGVPLIKDGSRWFSLLNRGQQPWYRGTIQSMPGSRVGGDPRDDREGLGGFSWKRLNKWIMSRVKHCLREVRVNKKMPVQMYLIINPLEIGLY